MTQHLLSRSEWKGYHFLERYTEKGIIGSRIMATTLDLEPEWVPIFYEAHSIARCLSLSVSTLSVSPAEPQRLGVNPIDS